MRVPADGSSTITLSATVREGTALAPTPVSVMFTTTAGELQPMSGGAGAQQLIVQTQAGRAQVLLRSTTYETSALVLCSLVGTSTPATDQTSVAFGLKVADEKQFEDILKISASYLAYHPGLQTFEAIGDAAVSYQGIEIRSPRLQLFVGEEMLVARDVLGRVTVGVGSPPYAKVDNEAGQPYAGDALLFDLRTFAGALYSTRSGQTYFFGTRSLTPAPKAELPTDAFDFLEIEEANMEIRARTAVVYPGDKIRFDMPQFFVGGRKVFSLPYYFEPLGYNAGGAFGAGANGFSQFFNYSSQDGLLVNFPYYFNMSDLATNEFTIARGQRSGVFGRQQGWQLYYRHYAELPMNKGNFEFMVDHIGPDFGLSYQRNQQIGQRGFASIDMNWPEHQSFYTNGYLYAPLGPGMINLTGNADVVGGNVYHNSNFVWQSNPLKLKAIGSRVSGSLGASWYHAPTGYDLWRQSASVTWDHDPWYITKGGMVLPYAGLRFQNTVNGAQEVGFTMNTSFRQELKGGISLGLGYTFDTTWNSKYNLPDRHVFALDAQINRNKWRGYTYSSYSLLDKAFTASALLDYSLTKRWGLQAQTVFQSSDYGSFHESELWAYHILGGRELRLRYNIERQRIYFEIDNSF